MLALHMLAAAVVVGHRSSKSRWVLLHGAAAEVASRIHIAAAAPVVERVPSLAAGMMWML